MENGDQEYQLVLNEEKRKPSPKKPRKNISNLPEERLNQVRGGKNKENDDILPMGFSDKKAGGKGKKTNFFAAWDDTD